MKNHIKNVLAVSGLALVVGAVGVLSLPSGTAAFTTIGGSLGTSQRDFRVWNNFTDASANNNVTPHVNFPGQTGAVMAIWKGHVEWASSPWGGNGLGDGSTTNTNLGDGGANFDNKFEGLHTATGGSNANVHSELAGSSGGVLAFTETPISDGWRIRYYSSWSWQDGPGGVGSGVDLQGVACHEIGHSLGLGHSTTGGATMYPSISGTGIAQRSIAADDIAGIQSIYGVKSGTKPTITSLGGSKQIGGVLQINGSQFSTTGNSVWFTNASQNGTSVVVSGVASTGGGTLITVTVPSGIIDGDVMVQKSGTGNTSLSNAFPIDIGAPAGDPPDVTSINPTQGPAGGFTSVVITGTGFTGTNVVRFGVNDALSFTVDSNTQITAEAPSGLLFTTVDVFVQDVEGADTLSSAYFYTVNPAPSVSTVTPNQGSIAGDARVTVSGASTVGVTGVTFGGVAGTDVDVVSPTEVQVSTPAHAIGFVDVVAQGNGSSTVVNGYKYVDPGQFLDIGPGIGGAFGVPSLTGNGDLSAGSVAGFNIVLSGALPLVGGTMFVSLSQGAAPFKGGTFYPLPILLNIAIVTDFVGGVNFGSAIPNGVPPGTSFVIQTWTNDVTAPKLVAGSNGMKAIVP